MSARADAASAGRKRLGLHRDDVRVCEPSDGLGGEVVVAARLHRGRTLTEAGKRQGVVAHGADVVLGLPDAATLDARA